MQEDAPDYKKGSDILANTPSSPDDGNTFGLDIVIAQLSKPDTVDRDFVEDGLLAYFNDASHSLLTLEQEQLLTVAYRAITREKNKILYPNYDFENGPNIEIEEDGVLEEGEEVLLERKRKEKPIPIDIATLDEKTQQRLEALEKEGNQIREILITRNLRLVVSIALRYQGSEMPLWDLISEGNIGLMKAVERFRPELGCRFSTYATYWIRQTITRAVANQGNTVRLPVHMYELRRKIRKASGSLERELNRPATDAEVARALEISISRVENAQASGIIANPLSLNTILRDTDGRQVEFGEMIPDNTQPEVGDEVAEEMMKQRVRGLLDGLSARERGVIEMRFGLDGKGEKTLQEVAGEFGVTRERIRQIEKNALARLRHPSIKQTVQEYLE